MFSSSAGTSSIFLSSPTSRKNIFQTFKSYSVFSTVFSVSCEYFVGFLLVVNQCFLCHCESMSEFVRAIKELKVYMISTLIV